MIRMNLITHADGAGNVGDSFRGGIHVHSDVL